VFHHIAIEIAMLPFFEYHGVPCNVRVRRVYPGQRVTTIMTALAWLRNAADVLGKIRGKG
jgi:hypothetical protein